MQNLAKGEQRQFNQAATFGFYTAVAVLLSAAIVGLSLGHFLALYA